MFPDTKVIQLRNKAYILRLSLAQAKKILKRKRL
jgi:hypothetical protein